VTVLLLLVLLTHFPLASSLSSLPRALSSQRQHIVGTRRPRRSRYCGGYGGADFRGDTGKIITLPAAKGNSIDVDDAAEKSKTTVTPAPLASLQQQPPQHQQQPFAARRGITLSLSSLSPTTSPWSLTIYIGDYIVHQTYGIGRFAGLEEVETLVLRETGDTVKGGKEFLKRREAMRPVWINDGTGTVSNALNDESISDLTSSVTSNSNFHPDLLLSPSDFDKKYLLTKTQALEIEYRDGKLLVLCDRGGLSRISLYRSAFLTGRGVGERGKGGSVRTARSRGTRLSSLRNQKGWMNEVEKAEDITRWQAKTILANYAARER